MTAGKRCKIVIFGAYGAGKSTLIKSIDPESRHVEAACPGGTTTVALDYGRVQVNDVCVHLFGTPGQERFEFAREVIARGMDGAVLIVDATSELDDLTRHFFDSLSSEKVPFAIFLNKCENVGANPESLIKEFGTSQVWKISALDRKQSTSALSDFVGSIPSRFDKGTYNSAGRM